MKRRRARVEGRRPIFRWLWLAVVCFAWCSVAQEEAPKLQPPLGEIPPTFWEEHGLTVILSAGGFATFVALGIWLWLRPKPEEVLPPEDLARTALEALAKRQEGGEVISQASQILRQYVLAVFELPTGQPTTAEFCKLVTQCDKVGEELSSALADFLRQCDDRKFAKSDSTASLNAAVRALELLERAEARREQLRQIAIGSSARPAVAST